MSHTSSLTPTFHVTLFCDSRHFIARLFVSSILRYTNAIGRWNLTITSIEEFPSILPDCDGVILCAPQFHHIPKIPQCPRPIVLIVPYLYPEIDRVSTTPIPLVTSDSDSFGKLAAEFFLPHAPRSYVYVGYDSPMPWDNNRKASFAQRIREAGYEPSLYEPLPFTDSPTDNAAHLQAFLASLPRPLAILAANDTRAQQVLFACQRAGIPVPYEAEILGIDNDEWLCESTRPSLSSIPIDSDDCGFEAAHILDSILRHNADPTLPLPPLRRTLPVHTIIERESTTKRTLSDPIVSRALAFIQHHRGLNIRVQDVADALGYTPGWIVTRFRHVLGTSILDEIAAVRHKTILHLICHTTLPFQEIAHRCGFTNASTLCRLIRKQTGKTATELRDQAAKP